MANALPLPCHDAPRADHADCPNPRATLTATVIASSLVFVLGSIVNVALPQMQDGFDVNAAGAQWIVNAYLLPLGAFVLIGGALGDHYGRRRVFVWGLAVFAASCVVCAVAPTFETFLAGRVLERIGAALIAPTSLAILSDAFTGRARGAAIGTWAGAGAAAGAVAPVAGGVIVDAVGWRWCFVAVLPLVVLAMWLGATRLRESVAKGSERAPLDWAGAALAAGGLLAAIWALVALPERGATPATMLAAATGTVLLAGFLVVERAKHDHAMVPLTLFSDRGFTGLSLYTFFLYAALGGLLLLLPYVLIRDLGYDATAAGAAILPFPLLLGVLSRWTGGALTDRWGARSMLTAGAGGVTLGFVLFAVLAGGDGGYATTILPGLVALALGMSLAVAPLTGAVLNAAGDDRAGVASGVNNAISRVGGLVATALLGLVMLGAADDLIAGFATASWVGAALAALSAGIAWGMVERARA
ncbi:MFS transporter [Jannaschia sp. LMIT008]|uniref:MFS transporter n=1 Tax=Jannaschia maritima TaxID=3032585 RepID=UPI002811E2FF|nr:MFS transporter [Jannaschia sp. LMIT008]